MNGDFATDTSGWQTEGDVVYSDNFAVVADGVATVTSIFQTTTTPEDLSLLTLSFFSEGMSGAVDLGELPDTVFATLYLGDQAFGDSVATPTFDVALPLFELDADGVRDVAGGAVVESVEGRPGWLQLSMLVQWTHQFATIALEIIDLNATTGDSVVAIDDVGLEQVPPGKLSYAVWLTLWFDVDERAQPELVDPDADPDGDGFRNKFEFFSGTNPIDTDSSPNPTLSFVPGESGAVHVAVTFRRSLTAGGVGYALEVSSDLQVWDDDLGATIVTVTPDASSTHETITLRTGDPFSNLNRLFLCLRIDLLVQ